MLKRNAQLFEGLFAVSDLVVVSIAWVLSYWLRFHAGVFPIAKGIPPFADYLRMLIFVWLIWAFVLRRFGLYKPMRGVKRLREYWLVIQANAFAVILLIAFTYLFREKSVPFSRLVFLIFWIGATTSMLLSRSAIRSILRTLRKRGYNLRYALIVGSGALAAKVARRMLAHPEFGVELRGCLAADDSEIVYTPEHVTSGTGQALALKAPRPGVTPRAVRLPRGVKVIGTYSQLPALLEEGGIDQVIVALPLCDHDKMESVIASIGDSMVDVRIVPDLHQFIQLGSRIEEFEGLPVVSLASTPLTGINRVTKRILDLVLGTAFLILALPAMVGVALAVKLTSRGPVFFSQERVGLDGRTFPIYKFRTMYQDAEADGARFAVRGDPRVTPVGRVLRRLSLDELPQLINVLRGHMSLVGPRPERPVFIKEFRRQLPRYMLRHKVQAGITGWAQVHGWRGNTSIEKRIEYDLYYIEHWSLALDLKIIGLTFLNSFRDRNAY